MWKTWAVFFTVLAIQRISAEERARAFAAPTGFNAIDFGNGETKDFLKIPGGYRDGFQKVIFEEVGPTNVSPSPDFPLNDRFGAYDDNSVVSDKAEIPLFIPLPYRNETAEEKAERARKEEAEKQARRGKLRPLNPATVPPPTRTIISNAAANGPQVTIRPTIPPSPPRTQLVNQQPTQFPNNQLPPQQQQFNRPFVAPQVPVPQSRPIPPPPPQSPPNSFQPPFNPQQQQTRPPFVPQQPQPRPTNTFIQPQRPNVGFTAQTPRQPQFNSVPQQQQSTFRPVAQTLPPQTTFTPPQTPFRQPFVPQQSTQAPFRPPFVPSQQTPQQPRFPASPSTTTLSPFAQQNQFRGLRPFQRPNNNFVPQQPSSSFAPPQTTRAPGGLRTGVCTRTIYYKANEATPVELQQPFSHFAVVVSIDQCARTAHEFNSGQAVFDPTNRHCQFNPGTSFAVQQTCEQWPNPIYRNNLPITARAVTIRCVTCQVRRRTPLRPFQRQNRAFGINQVIGSPISRSTLARRIHGVIINDNFTKTTNEDQMLNKALEAEQIVNFKQPTSAIKTTNLEHLEPMKSSSSAASNEKTVGVNEEDNKKIEEKVEEKVNEAEKLENESVKPFQETEKPFQRSGGIIVHKLHPIETVSLN